MTDLQKAEKRLLKAAPKAGTITSSVLFSKVEHDQPHIPTDTVRFAYWTLVSEGKLIRTPEGVRRKV
jgi:hypothetical protein